MNKEKVSKWFLIGVGIILLGLYLRNLIVIQPKLKEKGRYIIGSVYKYSNHKGGRTIFFEYKIKNKKYSNRNVTGKEVNTFINKKFIVKYVEGEEYISDILLEYPVPDSIKSVPPEGWKELPDWAKPK